MTHARLDRARGSGFTLVELLVVISIIALLIGILLPALGKAKAAGQAAVCSTQVRHSLQSTILFSGERKGQAPLAGQIWGFSTSQLHRDNPDLPGMWRENLTFWHNDQFDRYFIMPYFLTMADFDGVVWEQDGRENMLKAAGTSENFDNIEGPFLEYYRCPADRTFEIGNKLHASLTIFGAGNTSAWWTHPGSIPEMSSYMFNESVLGQSPGGVVKNRALEGRIDRALYPSDMFLVADGEPRQEWGDHFMTVWHDPNAKEWTMWNYIQTMAGVEEPYDKASQIDEDRHNGSMNVGFLDGHVDSRSITPGEMEETIIWRRLNK